MISKNKSIKKFAKSGKRLTKKYTNCVKYLKKQGAEVEEPEITEVFLTPEPEEPEMEEEVEPEEPVMEEEEVEPVMDEEELEPEETVMEEEEPVMEEEELEPEEPVMEEEEEPEVIPPTNDFKFVEPEKFRVQGQLLSGDRVLEIDPLNVVNETDAPEETMEMVSDEKVKPEKTTPKKVESDTPKRKKKSKGKKTRKRSSNSEKPKMKSLKSR